ncbi:MAG: superoxide dismutase [Lachnospiraceae bacterium]|nr:superoxide dismutase [Lachnospiraceae bacterium]
MFTQVKLAYDYSALEPHIDALTMETHYSKHHVAYTNGLNDAAAKAGVDEKSIEEILSNLDAVEDAALRKAIRNNGGGFYNHNLYFSIMSPAPKKAPEGKLKEAIDEAFGGVDALKDTLKKAAVGQFGSGWAWLSADKSGKLTVTATANQDNPYSEGLNVTPILGIDVWEHAYYLKYKNLRASYIDAFFEVLDWKAVEDNYAKAMA